MSHNQNTQIAEALAEQFEDALAADQDMKAQRLVLLMREVDESWGDMLQRQLSHKRNGNRGLIDRIPKTPKDVADLLGPTGRGLDD